MFKSINKDTKNAIIGAIIALFVSLIGFTGNWIYKNNSETAELNIAEVKQIFRFQEQKNNLPQEVITNFISYREFMVDALSDFDTICTIIRREAFSTEELATLKEAIQRCKKTYSYIKQIEELENKIKRGKINEISNNELKKYLSISFDKGRKKNWDEILYNLDDKKNFEKQREAVINAICDSTLALQSKPSKRAGELELQIAIFNSGNSNAMVFTDATISFQGKDIKYSCHGNKSAVCIQPFSDTGNNYIMLCPCTDKDEDMDDWKELILQGQIAEFTITLKTDNGRPIKATKSLMPYEQ